MTKSGLKFISCFTYRKRVIHIRKIMFHYIFNLYHIYFGRVLADDIANRLIVQ